MSTYIKSDNRVNVYPGGSVTATTKLEPNVYAVNLVSSPAGKSYYLTVVDNFSLPKKIYGDTEKRAKRIMQTFFAREGSTGVGLTGMKGSGKTLLSKLLSVKLQEQGVPTLLINQDLHGEEFNMFIQSIDQPVVIIFDEFEKNYHEAEKQQAILTLFDGVYPTKKLFIVTMNNKHKADTNLWNRPGRLYYLYEYGSLEQEFVETYCQDNLYNKSEIEKIISTTSTYSEFNFDMLKTIVEEMNRFNESFEEVIKHINVRHTSSKDVPVQAEIYYNEKLLPPSAYVVPNTFDFDDYFNVKFKGQLAVDVAEAMEVFDHRDKPQTPEAIKQYVQNIGFDRSDLVSIDKFTFTHEYFYPDCNIRVIVKPEPLTSRNWEAF